MQFSRSTPLVLKAVCGQPLRHCLESWDADCRQVLGGALPRAAAAGNGPALILVLDPKLAPEQFRLTPEPASGRLLIAGGDELGLVFALYHLSREALGVDPYDFWTDREPPRLVAASLPDAPYLAPLPKARFRGWFINDEDLLIGWHDEMRISLDTWRRIFETMLRGGYNMVIPGTGMPAGEAQFDLAAAMGLWITHHHCEPLGSRMYNEFYPGEPLRIPEDLPRFDAIYREAIAANRGRRVVWGLGFRGQGDEAFFKGRPEFDTVEKRGAVISRMIRRQRELVTELHDGPAFFCHNIYAESAELYQAGVLDLDPDIIRVFGDNGFGAMRARPSSYYTVDGDIPARPRPDDLAAPQGVYYHFSFLGGGAASKMTPLVDPELVADEIAAACGWGRLEFVIANVSAVKPQMFHAELLDRILRPRPGAGNAWVADQYREWCGRHFPAAAVEVETLFREYFQAFFQHGVHRDDRAGEQLYHNTLRCIVNGVLTGDESRAISPKHHALRTPPPPHCRPTDVTGCLELLHLEAGGSLPGWRALVARAAALQGRLPAAQARLFADTVGLYVDYNQASVEGFVEALAGVLAYRRREWQSAFVAATAARRWYRLAVRRLEAAEHGRWRHFYRGDWKTGSRETVRVVSVLQGMAKLQGESGRGGWVTEALGESKDFGAVKNAYLDWDVIGQLLAERRAGRLRGCDLAALRQVSAPEP